MPAVLGPAKRNISAQAGILIAFLETVDEFVVANADARPGLDGRTLRAGSDRQPVYLHDAIAQILQHHHRFLHLNQSGWMAHLLHDHFLPHQEGRVFRPDITLRQQDLRRPAATDGRPASSGYNGHKVWQRLPGRHCHRL